MVLGLVAMIGLLLSAAPSTAAKKQLTFRVTIVNLGKANLTSPVWAVHNKRATLFRRGGVVFLWRRRAVALGRTTRQRLLLAPPA